MIELISQNKELLIGALLTTAIVVIFLLRMSNTHFKSKGKKS